MRQSGEHITAPVVSGTGTAGDPSKLTTTYGVDNFGSNLEVSKTFRYVNGDSFFLATYAIKNDSGTAQPVRVLVQGNLDHAGSPLRVGGYDPSPPPTSSASTMRAGASEVCSPQRLRGMTTRRRASAVSR